ncbi:MAG: branched-chain amino acid ABC transporter permease [Deltaproteobacteria bacterium]|nr:branched-chain amino acid ABC transporter permease [Deltaproteobacteria bacterium]
MDSTIAMYVAQFINGMAYGMLLFLVASGLTLIFGMMGILNIAHASFFMLSAYFCHTFLELTGSFWLALLLAPVVAAFFGILCERFLLRKIHAFGHIPELLITVGISLVILEGVKLFWGTEPFLVATPKTLQGFIWISDLKYPIYRVFIVGFAFFILGLMALVLYKTRLGMVVRAAVSDADMVNALGINVPLVFMLVFGIGTWLAGLAGVIITPILTVFPGMADQIGMDAFVVVVTGGFGSLIGAFIVSLCIGELNSFGIQFIPKLAPVLMFTFMAVVLAFKPTGFFGERE